MKKHISYPSIEQFRNIISIINKQYNFIGLDDLGEPIYDNKIAKPTLTFKGTIKLHGTNAGVSYNEIAGLWAQSRGNIITPQKDNAGFAFFMESNDDAFFGIINKISNQQEINLKQNTITIYGEWCGKGIQNSVAISKIEKSFFIFGIKITPFGIENVEKQPAAYWIDFDGLSLPERRIYNIHNFKNYSIDIDFNMPELVQNKLVEITEEVEIECPVAANFGISGIGEGVVWECKINDIVHRFKVKGEKHSASKVKKLACTDVEKISSIKEFVEYSVTENRFNQALDIVFPNKEPLDIKKLGDLLRWIINDITKEELDTMNANGLEPKDVNKYISVKAKNMFFNLNS